MTPALQNHEQLIDKYCDTVRERLDLLQREAHQALKLADLESKNHEPQLATWHPASEVPADDQLCVVVDTNGARYFLNPINGRWMPRVRWWLPVPPAPSN